VRFWDSSALVPLFIAEAESAQVERWLRADPDVVVWALTRIELLSAFARRRREDPKRARQLSAARRELLATWDLWTEVVALDVVRRHAERVIETHPLRAADALQLAAAIVSADEQPAGLQFVTFDERLADAAEKEGFDILTA
jgi:predicted nucleic acid-binding protein